MDPPVVRGGQRSGGGGAGGGVSRVRTFFNGASRPRHMEKINLPFPRPRPNACRAVSSGVHVRKRGAAKAVAGPIPRREILASVGLGPAWWATDVAVVVVPAPLLRGNYLGSQSQVTSAEAEAKADIIIDLPPGGSAVVVGAPDVDVGRFVAICGDGGPLARVAAS